MYALSIDRNGTILNDVLIVPHDSTNTYAGITWNGSGYGCVLPNWPTNGNASFKIIDEAGNMNATDTLMGPNGSDYSAKTIGNKYAVSWSEYHALESGDYEYPVKLYILDSAGNIASRNENISDVSMPHIGIGLPSLTWTGTNYCIAFLDWRNVDSSKAGEIYFARFDAQGIKIGTDIKITDINTDP